MAEKCVFAILKPLFLWAEHLLRLQGYPAVSVCDPQPHLLPEHSAQQSRPHNPGHLALPGRHELWRAAEPGRQLRLSAHPQGDDILRKIIINFAIVTCSG